MCAVVFEVPGGPGDQAGIGRRLMSRICFHDQALILESDNNYLLLWDILGCLVVFGQVAYSLSELSENSRGKRIVILGHPQKAKGEGHETPKSY